MESAAMAACAQFRGVQFGQILFTADSLANLDQHDPRDFGKDAHFRGLELATTCLTNL